MSVKEHIINLDDYLDDGIFEIPPEPCLAEGQSLLLLIHQGRYHVIENKCGHFGVPLLYGELRDNEIICAEHGISFNLDTGEVANRPFENCDPIKVFVSEKKGHFLSIQIS